MALLARRLGKTPVMASDTPGFIVNRVAARRTTSRRSGSSGRARPAWRRSTTRCAGSASGWARSSWSTSIGADINLAAEHRASSRASSATRATGRTAPAARSSTPGASAGRRTAASTTTGPMARAAHRGPAWPGAVAARPPARRGADRGAHPVGHRQRGSLGGRRWGRDAGRDRYRHAARHELAGGPARLGRAHRPGVGGPHARRPPRLRAGRPLPGRAPAAHARRPTAAPSSPRTADGCRSAVAIGPSSSTWTACCSTPRRSGTRPRPSSSGATATSSRGTTRWRSSGPASRSRRATSPIGWAGRGSEAAALVDEMVSLMHDRVRRQVDARPGAVELVAGSVRSTASALGLASNSPRFLVDDALATAGLVDVFDDDRHLLRRRACQAGTGYLPARVRAPGRRPVGGPGAGGLRLGRRGGQGGGPDLHRRPAVRRD